MSRLTELAVSKRSVVLLLAIALFIAGISAWGSLKQELLPDIQLPIITVVAADPGAGASDVADQVAKPIERAISAVPQLQQVQSTSANSIALVVAQFSYGTNVKDTKATIAASVAALKLPQGVTPQVSSLDINASPVIIASISGTGADGQTAAATVASAEVVPDLQGLSGVASVDVAGGLTSRLVVTLDPAEDGGGRRLDRPGPGRPGGEQPDASRRAAGDGRQPDPGLHVGLVHHDRPGPRPGRERAGP